MRYLDVGSVVRDSRGVPPSMDGGACSMDEDPIYGSIRESRSRAPKRLFRSFQ